MEMLDTERYYSQTGNKSQQQTGLTDFDRSSKFRRNKFALVRLL